jgi:hypothetical protein
LVLKKLSKEYAFIASWITVPVYRFEKSALWISTVPVFISGPALTFGRLLDTDGGSGSEF